MTELWSDRKKFQVWLEVELAVTEEWARMGVVPRKDWLELKKRCDLLLKKGGVDPREVERIENITKHDVIAFTTAVAEQVGPVSRTIHFGLTSSDVVDTALSILIQRAGELLKKDLAGLIAVLKKQAIRYRDLPCIGRSHGMHAEPTAFGLKFLGFYCEMKRNEKRLVRALEGLRVGKLSGAVGTGSHIDPVMESKILKRLGLRREWVATQVLPRDRHAEFLNALSSIGNSLERMAVEFRHLQRSEVGELREGFTPGQKGSSAMPHKRNPISSENLTGVSRLLRSYAQAAQENVALWHERDISHSSVERVILPDATQILDYALVRATRLVEGLQVNEKGVKANLEKAGATVFSGHYLLALVRTGATREDAYAWIQECALASLDGKASFESLVLKHPEISKRLKPAEIKKMGTLKTQLRQVRKIYAEAFRSNAE
jgi:adenylosuccinate lyase